MSEVILSKTLQELRSGDIPAKSVFVYPCNFDAGENCMLEKIISYNQENKLQISLFLPAMRFGVNLCCKG